MPLRPNGWTARPIATTARTSRPTTRIWRQSLSDPNPPDPPHRHQAQRHRDSDMRIALIQLGYDDREPVSDRVTRAADLVRAQASHDLVVLPELWAPGGFSYKEWDKRAEPVDGPIALAMSAAARDAGVMLHAGSIIERPAGGERGPEGKDLWN